MNNGRDCPHGRQVGKCDTCDLIKTELGLEKVTSERDALAAQVGAQQVLLKCWQSWLGASRESCDDSGANLWDKIEEACNAKPQHHLAAHDAEVAAKAVENCLDVKRFRWLCENVADEVCQSGELVALKTKYKLPLMIAYADFCGPIRFADAVDLKMQEQADQLRAKAGA